MNFIERLKNTQLEVDVRASELKRSEAEEREILKKADSERIEKMRDIGRNLSPIIKDVNSALVKGEGVVNIYRNYDFYLENLNIGNTNHDLPENLEETWSVEWDIKRHSDSHFDRDYITGKQVMISVDEKGDIKVFNSLEETKINVNEDDWRQEVEERVNEVVASGKLWFYR